MAVVSEASVLEASAEANASAASKGAVGAASAMVATEESMAGATEDMAAMAVTSADMGAAPIASRGKANLSMTLGAMLPHASFKTRIGFLDKKALGHMPESFSYLI